jgi:hypothetical protein
MVTSVVVYSGPLGPKAMVTRPVLAAKYRERIRRASWECGTSLTGIHSSLELP